MRKKNTIKFALMIIFIFIFVCSVIGLYLLHTKKQPQSNPFKIAVNNSELLVQSKETFNSVNVYQQKNQLVINAESEAEFFNGAQFTVKTKQKISASDVEIQWTTVGGGTQSTAENQRIIAEIKVRENGTVIFDQKINFAQKAFDAVKEGFKKRPSS